MPPVHPEIKFVSIVQMNYGGDGMPDTADGLTVGEASVVTGLRPDQINDAIDRKRVPSRWVTAEGGRRRLDKKGLVAFVIETSLAGRVPAEIRQRWYARLA